MTRDPSWELRESRIAAVGILFSCRRLSQLRAKSRASEQGIWRRSSWRDPKTPNSVKQRIVLPYLDVWNSQMIPRTIYLSPLWWTDGSREMAFNTSTSENISRGSPKSMLGRPVPEPSSSNKQRKSKIYHINRIYQVLREIWISLCLWIGGDFCQHWKFRKMGEIDLVVEKSGLLIFSKPQRDITPGQVYWIQVSMTGDIVFLGLLRR
jgi:hypothetical protein